MKKSHLLAGFFILISSLQVLANNNRADTIPSKKAQFSNYDFRFSFYQWRISQGANSLNDPQMVGLRSQYITSANSRSRIRLSWWPQAIQLNKDQARGLSYALSGFASGFSTGLSTTNNYYYKNTYDWEVNKSFYSWSSFLIGAGLGTALGLKDSRRFHY